MTAPDKMPASDPAVFFKLSVDSWWDYLGDVMEIKPGPGSRAKVGGRFAEPYRGVAFDFLALERISSYLLRVHAMLDLPYAEIDAAWRDFLLKRPHVSRLAAAEAFYYEAMTWGELPTGRPLWTTVLDVPPAWPIIMRGSLAFWSFVLTLMVLAAAVMS